MTTISTAPQRGVLASFATIRTLTNIFVGSVALMFAMTATADILAELGTGTGPNGIVLDTAGNVYTANFSSNNVSKITPDGTPSILAETGAGTLPEGIAIDATGNVYTANLFSSNVSKITPDGTPSILGTTGDAPVAIAIDADGNVYTANYSSNNVSKILAPVAPVPAAATPVPVGPLWLLGMMATLLSLVAVNKLRKA